MNKLFNITKLVIIICFGIICLSTTTAHAKSKWKQYKRTHFIVYYQNAPLDFVKTVEDAAEEYYKEITRNLGFTRYKGWSWDERAKIYIFDDQEHYVGSRAGMNWSHGSANPRNKVIRTFPAAHGFFDSTLPHELGHIIFREFVGYKTKIPRWFEEGVAMYQEKAKRWGAHRIVKQAIEDGSFIPLQQLTVTSLSNRTSKEKVQLFYSEAASVVNYLINELGQQRFVRFCRELEEGRRFDWALDSVYVRFDDIEELNDAWVKYLERQ